MQKITLKYLLWKAIIYLLLMVMALPLTFPAAFIMKNSVAPLLSARILSAAALLIFLFFQNWLIGRSDLSKISRGAWLLGESLTYALLTLLAAAVTAAVSGGLHPRADLWFVPLFPTLTFSYAFDNLAAGAALQIALYPAAALILYVLKKKKNPALTRNGKTAAPHPAFVSEFSGEEAEDPGASGEIPEGNGNGLSAAEQDEQNGPGEPGEPDEQNGPGEPGEDAP